MKLSNLKTDDRLMIHNDFVKKVVSTYDLNDTQISELNHFETKKIESPHIDDIVSFLKNSEKILVVGDYDADGVSATSIAILILESIKIDAGFYIPHRGNEGYGINKKIIDLAYAKGYQEILLVDNGIKSFEEIEYAISLGIKIAIVDHHLIEGEVPNVPLLHPDFLDEYGKNMSAGGLMVLVAEAMNLLSPKILAYGAIATVADVMPLWHKNREIVLLGLDALTKNNILNIDYLWKRYNNPYDEDILGFQINPKINTAGRMFHLANMNNVVKYLLEDDQRAIRQFSDQLLELNKARQDYTKEGYNHFMKKINDEAIDIIENDKYHEGVLGLIANQMINQTNKAAILLMEYDDHYKGSARSNTISIKELIEKMDPNYFLVYGGHDQAFGLSLKKEYLEAFKKDAQEIAVSLDLVNDAQKVIELDINPSEKDIIELLKLAPFGEGFNKPLFELSGFTIKNIRPLNTSGYKLEFENYFLKDAVLFNSNISQFDLYKINKIDGYFTYHSRFGLSFNIRNYDI